MAARERAEGRQHEQRVLRHEAAVGNPIAARTANRHRRVQVAADREARAARLVELRGRLVHEVKRRLVERAEAGVDAEVGGSFPIRRSWLPITSSTAVLVIRCRIAANSANTSGVQPPAA